MVFAMALHNMRQRLGACFAKEKTRRISVVYTRYSGHAPIFTPRVHDMHRAYDYVAPCFEDVGTEHEESYLDSVARDIADVLGATLNRIIDPRTVDGYVWRTGYAFTLHDATTTVLFPKRVDGASERSCAFYPDGPVTFEGAQVVNHIAFLFEIGLDSKRS